MTAFKMDMSTSGSINLLSDLRNVAIECDKPFQDGYAPSNLITANVNGFTAERFIRPPITLTVRFPCLVRIQSIHIDNSRGSFASTGFEIRSYSGNFENDEKPIYMPIGKVYNCLPGFVKFVNKRFCRRANREPAGVNSPNEINLFSHNSALLNCCRSMTITITRTLNNLPAVIPALSIKGVPLDASFIKRPRLTVDAEVSQIPAQQPATASSFSNKNSNADPMTSAAKEIPEDFNDALTHNLMSFPVTLPSGKVIDQSSLDKIYNTAKTFGCHAVDPFTGIKLSDTYKPITNHLLRERIDRYVSLNQITSTGRISGVKRKLPMNSLSLASPTTSETSQTDNINKTDTHREGLNTEISSINASDLNYRVKQILSRPKKLRTVLLKPEPTITCDQCLKEGNLRDATIAFYALGCDHLICKDCVLKESKFITCCVCSRRTTMCNLKRFRPTTTTK